VSTCFEQFPCQNIRQGGSEHWIQSSKISRVPFRKFQEKRWNISCRNQVSTSSFSYSYFVPHCFVHCSKPKKRTVEYLKSMRIFNYQSHPIDFFISVAASHCMHGIQWYTVDMVPLRSTLNWIILFSPHVVVYL
jgi:hypothetical protein